MTVTYIQHVLNGGKVGAFLRLLLMWKGSVYKVTGVNLLIFCSLYTLISVLYRYILSQNEQHKLAFEHLCVYFSRSEDFIPLGFILGFYVNQVVNRWWGQYNCIVWPDTLALNLISFMPGQQGSTIRRTIVRLANLSSILCLRRVSSQVARRFPTYDHLIEAGLMTIKEKDKLDELHSLTENRHQITWYPIKWASHLLSDAMSNNLVKSDIFYKELQKNLTDISNTNAGMISYSWINIPLVYTQLVTIAVHLYFFVTLFGRQFLDPTMYLHINGTQVPVGPLSREGTTLGSFNLCGYDNKKDFYFPFFTIIQFIFYFGWLKVAESLINPFGDDDDDFELNYIIDRNFQVSYLMVDDLEVKDFIDCNDDIFSSDLPPATLPYTFASMKEEEDVKPTYVTDNIINNVVIEDLTGPLFAPESRAVSGASSVMGSPKYRRRRSRMKLDRRHSEVMSVGSILHRNLLRNFSHVGDLEENPDAEEH